MVLCIISDSYSNLGISLTRQSDGVESCRQRRAAYNQQRFHVFPSVHFICSQPAWSDIQKWLTQPGGSSATANFPNLVLLNVADFTNLILARAPICLSTPQSQFWGIWYKAHYFPVFPGAILCWKCGPNVPGLIKMQGFALAGFLQHE